MGRFRALRGRHRLEMAVVVVPLLAILVLQYVSSRRLAEVEVIAHQTTVARYLEAVAADVRILYEMPRMKCWMCPGMFWPRRSSMKSRGTSTGPILRRRDCFLPGHSTVACASRGTTIRGPGPSALGLTLMPMHRSGRVARQHVAARLHCFRQRSLHIGSVQTSTWTRWTQTTVSSIGSLRVAIRPTRMRESSASSGSLIDAERFRTRVPATGPRSVPWSVAEDIARQPDRARVG